MDEIKRVAIVGAGAVGGYYGARLAQAKVDVCFLMRSDYDYVKKHGLAVQSIAGDFKLTSVQCAQSSEEIGPVDLVIVSWKTTSNSHYQKVISPLLHPNTQILTLQNGLGNVEELARLFPAHHIYGGLCFVCLNRIGPGRIDHTASGKIRVGEYQRDRDEHLPRLVAFLKSRGIDCSAVENLEQAQWLKLIWNIPFNGLAIAEGGVDTRVLLETPGMEQRIRRIMLEVKDVAESLGHVTGHEFIEQQINLTRAMKSYRPSSMIDYINGRKVEVDAIWREPLLRAHQQGVPVPKMERLLAEIEQRLEERNGKS